MDSEKRNKDHDIRIDFEAPKLWSSDWCIPSHQSRLPCADSPPNKKRVDSMSAFILYGHLNIIASHSQGQQTQQTQWASFANSS